jgi:D-sedoheptulose 7-phosphate isomerase
MNYDDIILKQLTESSSVKLDLIQQSSIINKIGLMLIKCLRSNNTIFLVGNGGSASDAQHITAELVGTFGDLTRKGLSAISLSTNVSTLTSIGNDIGFTKIFSRQVEALMKKNDVLIAFSTSGKSQNILEACKTAKSKGSVLIGLTGKNNNPLSKISDITLHVPSNNTQRIQESHITIGHILCSIIENHLKNNKI